MKTHNILNIEEFKTNIGNNSRLLGIDPGSKNIGLAICDENKKVATPLKVIQKTKFEILLKEIKEIINENNVKGIVVGNPLNMDGSDSEIKKDSDKFSDLINKRYNVPVELMDERLTTREARARLKSEEGSFISSGKDTHQIAAQIILENWFSENR